MKHKTKRNVKKVRISNIELPNYKKSKITISLSLGKYDRMNKLITRVLLLIIIPFPSFAQTEKDSTGAHFTFLTSRAYDFGAVLTNSFTTAKFEFKNSGTTPLIIKSISGSPKGLKSPNYKLILSYPQSPVMPGMQGIIEFTFKAAGDTGSFKNEILVTSNATPLKYPLLYITGVVYTEYDHTDTAKKQTIPAGFSSPVIGTDTK